MTRVTITGQEARFVAWVTAGVLLVTTLPYAFAYLTAPPQKQFMGIMLDVPDTAQYFSWMRGSIDGFMIPNRMTPEPNAPVFFNLLWWLLGRLSAVSGLGLAQVYQVFRIIAAALYLPAAYYWCAALLSSPSSRRTAWLLTVVSSGFGWMLVVGKYVTGSLVFPLDIYLPEPNSFLSILAFPHFVISVFLILVIFTLFILGTRRGRLTYLFLAGIAGLILGLEHAYDLLTVYTVLAVYVAMIGLRTRNVPWMELKSWALITGLSCAPALYFAYLTSRDPLWSRVLDQFVNAGVFTPDPFHLTVLLGLPLLIAVLTFDGFRSLFEENEEILFAKAWFLAGFVLMYLPVEYQVHFLSGWQIPVALLATVGFRRHIVPFVERSCMPQSKKSSGPWKRRICSIGAVRLRALAAAMLLLAVIPTNVYLWMWRFVDLGRYDYPFYLHSQEVAAMEWLEVETDATAVVLSSLTVGQYVPAIAGNTAFLAHWAQTVDFYEKRNHVINFFKEDTSDADRRSVVCSFSIDYVFHGPAEQALGTYEPSEADWLKKVYTNPPVAMYQVEPDLCPEY